MKILVINVIIAWIIGLGWLAVSQDESIRGVAITRFASLNVAFLILKKKIYKEKLKYD